MIAVDERNADARDRLAAELRSLRARDGWQVAVEQALTARDLYVARVSHVSVPGHVTIEASGYRRAGGYEYLVSVYDSAGVMVRGPSSFSMTPHAVYWARVWLLER